MGSSRETTTLAAPGRGEPVVGPDIRTAEGLPARAFTDPEFLRVELGTIFNTNWSLVPLRPAQELRTDRRTVIDLVGRRGSQLPFTLFDRPFFLQRDWKGFLRAFPNVCTHAWHTLVEGLGRERTITCPQHGRQFDCAGRVLAHAAFKGAAGFPRPEDHLSGLAVDRWEQFLFVCPGPPVRKLGDVLAPLRRSLVRMGTVRFQRMPMDGEVREVDGNWKQHVWNYLDRFHIAYIHKAPGGLADAIDLPSYRTELFPDSVLQWVFAKDPAHGFDPKRLPGRFRDRAGRRVFALWWFVYPNLALNFYPWGLSVNVFMPVPERPERTLFHWYHYISDRARYRKKDSIYLDRQVDAEDIDAMSQVLRGASSGYAPRVRFAPGEEEGPHWFHRRVAESTVGR